MKNAANKSLKAALALAEQGIPCFPCTLSKVPATPHGFKDASNDPLVIRELFRFRPDALIGVPTDGSSGLNVLDVDPARWRRMAPGKPPPSSPDAGTSHP
jgi:hypothetical protein